GGHCGLATPVPEVYLVAEDLPGPRVATLPSPYAFSRVTQATTSRTDLIGELTREVLAPVVGAVAARGYEAIHLQEPWLAYFGIDDEDWNPFEKALTDLRNAAGDRTLVLHLY